MGSKAQTVTAELTAPGKTGKRGTIIMHAESVPDSNLYANFQLKGINLKNQIYECFCIPVSEETPTFYEISKPKKGNPNVFGKIYQSTVAKKSSNPTWTPHKMHIG